MSVGVGSLPKASSLRSVKAGQSALLKLMKVRLLFTLTDSCCRETRMALYSEPRAAAVSQVVPGKSTKLASEISGELDVDAVTLVAESSLSTVKVEPSISLAMRPPRVYLESSENQSS